MNYEDALEASSDLLAEAVAVKAKLDASFTTQELKALEMLMPYFLEEIVPVQGEDRGRLTLDHVMIFLKASAANRTRHFNTITKWVDNDLILVAERGTGGRYGTKCTIQFLRFQGFVNALLLFRNDRAKLAQRLAAKCTQIMMDMQQEMRQGIAELRKSHRELQKKYFALEASQQTYTEHIENIF